MPQYIVKHKHSHSKGCSANDSNKKMVTLSPKLVTIITLLISFPLTRSIFDTSSPTIELPISTHSPPITLCVSDFGATGDGLTYDTVAIQSAIDACPCTIPCHVTFPPGTYLTATIHLKSRVILNIEEDAVLLGGTEIEDYPKESSRWYVVMAENAIDVGITGGGVIDGQGLKFVVKKNEKKNVMVSWNQTGACSGDECRPRLVGFLNCKNVNIWGIRLREPAYWWSVLFAFSFSF